MPKRKKPTKVVAADIIYCDFCEAPAVRLVSAGPPSTRRLACHSHHSLARSCEKPAHDKNAKLKIVDRYFESFASVMDKLRKQQAKVAFRG